MRLYHFRVLDLRFDRKRQPKHDKVDYPTMEPPPSEKHCKREAFNIVGLQMISRDTPFLRYQADRQSVILGSDFV